MSDDESKFGKRDYYQELVDSNPAFQEQVQRTWPVARPTARKWIYGGIGAYVLSVFIGAILLVIADKWNWVTFGILLVGMAIVPGALYVLAVRRKKA